MSILSSLTASVCSYHNSTETIASSSVLLVFNCVFLQWREPYPFLREEISLRRHQGFRRSDEEFPIHYFPLKKQEMRHYKKSKTSMMQPSERQPRETRCDWKECQYRVQTHQHFTVLVQVHHHRVDMQNEDHWIVI